MPDSKTKKSPPPSFEDAVEKLEDAIERIESGEIGLEESLEQYTDGMKLINHCRNILDKAENKIKKLSLDADKNIVEQDAPNQPS